MHTAGVINGDEVYGSIVGAGEGACVTVHYSKKNIFVFRDEITKAVFGKIVAMFLMAFLL